MRPLPIERHASGSWLARARLIFGAGLAALVVLGVISLARHYADPAYSKTRGWRELAASITRLSAGLPPDAVIVAQNFPDPTLWYYYRGPVGHVMMPPAAHDETGADQEAARLAELGVRRVILPVQPAAWWDDRGIAEAALSRAWSRVAEETIGVWPVQVYAHSPVALAPVGQPFRDGPVLAEAAVEPTQTVAGGLITAYLRWTGNAATLDGSEKITLQLLDASGALAAQVDRPFAAADIGGLPATYGILAPETAAPGQYQVIAALYRPEPQGLTRLLTEDGRDHIPLATITIE
jgi:hypothetical protein